MKGVDLDSYTATFKNLAAKAGYDLTAAATIDLHSGGLSRGLLSAILRRDSPPDTFNEWVEAAQKEQRKYAMIRAWVGLDSGAKRVGGKTREEWRKLLTNTGGRTHHTPARDPDAMDVDRIRVNLTDEEMQRYRIEGRCFRCSAQGHLSRDCPKKTSRTQGGTTTSRAQGDRRGNASARVAEVADSSTPVVASSATASSTTTNPVKIDRTNFLSTIRSMKTEDREDIMDALFDEDFS